MLQPSKTVFISYRRTNVPWALNVFQYLTQHGFDVFFDYETIGSGDFESIILENVLARSHFLIVLTPSSLERCSEPGDWFRREIETAIDSKRNIVPLMLESFDFNNPKIANQLTGKLASLKGYNGIGMNAEYFFAAMEKLRTKYLHVHLATVPHPASEAAQTAATEQSAAAKAAPIVQEAELTAQEYFERAYALKDPAEKIRLYSEAIRLDRDLYQAFYNRGVAQKKLGNLDAAIADYTQAIQLKPDYHEAFYNRALLYRQMGRRDLAIADLRKYLEVGGGEKDGDTEKVEKLIRDMEPEQ